MFDFVFHIFAVTHLFKEQACCSKYYNTEQMAIPKSRGCSAFQMQSENLTQTEKYPKVFVNVSRLPVTKCIAVQKSTL